MRGSNGRRARRVLSAVLAGLALALLAPEPASAQRPSDAGGRRLDAGLSARPRSAAPEPGEAGAPGLAIFARKILALPYEGPQVYDNAVLLVRDGHVEAVGPRAETKVPEGYAELDVGERWLCPGYIDLHCHIAGTFDINDMVYLSNPGLRAYSSVIPANPSLERAVAGGVTSVLFIPGSGTNCSGQGVLVKTGLEHFEDALIRNPGSLKVAQSGNPERWTVGVGRSFMNWNTRNTMRRGTAYAKRWAEHEAGRGTAPARDLEFDVFRELVGKRTQISVHTQMFQVVLMTLTMLRQEFGFDVYLDHSSLGGYRTAPVAKELGVPAICGPRQIEIPSANMIRWTQNSPEGMFSFASKYQEAGLVDIGFNTDSPVVPQEELSVQATVAVRFGFDGRELQAVRGLTCIPAKAAGIGDRVGSLTPHRDADVLVISGDPADPRTSVEIVFIEGRRVYDTERDPRRW